MELEDRKGSCPHWSTTDPRAARGQTGRVLEFCSPDREPVGRGRGPGGAGGENDCLLQSDSAPHPIPSPSKKAGGRDSGANTAVSLAAGPAARKE
jgi:hypothetical protein